MLVAFSDYSRADANARVGVEESILTQAFDDPDSGRRFIPQRRHGGVIAEQEALQKVNSRSRIREPMELRTKRLLEEFYSPFNERLYLLLRSQTRLRLLPESSRSRRFLDE